MIPSTRAMMDAALALVFHLALAALAVLAWDGARLAADPAQRSLKPDAAQVLRTRAALDAALAPMLSAPPERAVARELERGNLAAARGLLLVWADGVAPDGRSDRDRLAARVAALPPDVRTAYEQTAAAEIERPKGERQAAVIVTAAAPGAPARTYAADELRGLMLRAAQWLTGERIDGIGFGLDGLRLAAAPGDTPLTPEMLGHSADLIRVARRSGKLDPTLEREIEVRLAQALPPPRLQRELTEAFRDPFDPAAPVSIPPAFTRALEPEAARTLGLLLAPIAGLRANLSTAGALELLQDARSLEDLQRLHLAAAAGGDRAAAAARFLDRETVLRTVQGRLVVTARLRRDIGLAGGALLLAGLALAGVVSLQRQRLENDDAEPESAAKPDGKHYRLVPY